MSIIRFLMLLSLVVWVGGIIFFAFVLAPTVFHPGILPSRQLSGAVVSRSLGMLHWIGLACGILFLITSVVDSQVMTGFASPFAATESAGLRHDCAHADQHVRHFNPYAGSA